MNRRDAIATVSWIMGTAVIGAEAFLTSCHPASNPENLTEGILTQDQIAFLNEVGETILPATVNSPGAKEARVGELMNVIVSECYDEPDQKIFLTGMDQLNEKALELQQAEFLKLDAKQKEKLLLILDEEAKNWNETRSENDPEKHYYSLFKQLTLLGFLTSEVGVKKAMRHHPVPGHFDPCIDYKEGEKAFS